MTDSAAPRRRTAVVASTDLDRVRAYLPTNYAAHYSARVQGIIIDGTDEAGWTLDGYVIPRLASGLLFAKEFQAKELSA